MALKITILVGTMTGTAQLVVSYGGQRKTFTVDTKPADPPTEPAPKPAS